MLPPARTEAARPEPAKIPEPIATRTSADLRSVTSGRASLDTPGVFHPEKDENVKIRGMKGRFKFVRFESDRGGDFAVVVGGLSGHRRERCVTVDRLISTRPRGRKRRVKTVELEIRSDLGEQDEQRDV